MNAPSLALCSLAAITAALTAQESPRPAPADTVPALVYPRDKDRVIARVDGRELTLEDLVLHMTERHDPMFRSFIASPGGERCFSEDRLGADWIRQYADVVALEAEGRRRNLDTAEVDKHLGEALKQGFEPWLKQQRMPSEVSQRIIDFHLARYQRHYGLETEVKGWLDALVADDEVGDRALREFFTSHVAELGGVITFSHILVANRDPHTLRLMDEEGRQHAWDKITDIKQRIKEDGSNFEELAADYSEDRRTAVRGGKLENVERFAPALPAALCRAAWNLRDGETTGPIESPYGLHLVKRISMTIKRYYVFSDGAKPTIRAARRRLEQENLLFELRKKLRVALYY